MKLFRTFTIIIVSILAILMILMSIYIKCGYQLYFKIGNISIGNSNNNVLYVIIGLIFFVLALYLLIHYIIKKRGIILSIIFFFMIFLLPFFFLITNGMNKNHSFTYKTENKNLLIMGYGKNKEDKMKYEIYEKLFSGFYDKIATIYDVGFMLNKDNVIKYEAEVDNNCLYYFENNNTLTLSYYDINNEKIEITVEYKH